MKLQIQTGHELTNNIQVINDYCVRFVAEDGKTMFEITSNDDGSSIEIRSVDMCRVNGILYNGMMEIIPRCANSITVKSQKHFSNP